jgi:hypothetical protein
VTVRAVVFDVGETLVDETDSWGDWADWLGITRLTMFATLGSVIARGGDHREVFDLVRPGIDLAAEAAARRTAGRRPIVMAEDFVSIFIRRGPWAIIQAGATMPAEAAATIDSLAELTAILTRP